MTSQNLLIVNLKFLLMILPFTTKSHLYSGAHDGRWNWTQPNVKRCVFLTNDLHLLLYTTVKISPFSGNKEWSIWAFTWISDWPGETTSCKFVHSKATRVLNLLRRKLYGCSQSAKCQSFCSLVLPILQYSCQLWMPYYKKDIALSPFRKELADGFVIVRIHQQGSTQFRDPRPTGASLPTN